MQTSALIRKPLPGAAYGLRWANVHPSTDLRPGTDEPCFQVRWRPSEGPPPDEPEITSSRAVVPLCGYSIDLDRERRTLTVVGDRAPSGGDLVHPGLAVAAAVANAWLGREVLQGGVVVGAAGAVAVLGSSGAGKTTVLASAALAGFAVLSDELVVMDGGRALAGAATMALRHDVADLLALDLAGRDPLWSGAAVAIHAGDAPPRAPLVGWVDLHWAEHPGVRRLGPAERLATLGRHRLHGPLHGGGGALMALAGLPGWRLGRPAGPDGRAAADALLGELLRDGPG